VAFSSIIKRTQTEDPQTVDLVLRQFRCLIADLCQQFNGGHPGREDHFRGLWNRGWKGTSIHKHMYILLRATA
jgi:dihydroxyacetone synthase